MNKNRDALRIIREPRTIEELLAQANRQRLRTGVGAIGIGIAIGTALVCLLAIFAYAEDATPKPDLSAQTCEVRAHGQSLTVTCESSAVCPPGYHLFTRILDPAAAGSIDVMFGYGNDQERENTCMLNSAQAPGLTQGGKQIEVFHVGGAH